MKPCCTCKQFLKIVCNDECSHCHQAKTVGIPHGYSSEEWVTQIRKKQEQAIWDGETPPTITDIPSYIICLCLMVDGGYCREVGMFQRSVNLAKRITSCVQVSRDWRDYFNQDVFWKHIYQCVRVDKFYENRLYKMLDAKDKKLRSTGWSNVDIRSNQCKMVVVNQSKDVPFDIYWVYKKKTKTDSGLMKYMGSVQPRKMYKCGITFPNAKWMCIPTKEWLYENPYSNVGFSWVIDVFQLKEYEDKTVSPPNNYLTYLIDIRELDFTKIHRIKGIDNDYENYQDQIIPILVSETEYNERKKTSEKKKKKILQVYQKKMQEVKDCEKEISEIDEEVRRINYVLDMFK